MEMLEEVKNTRENWHTTHLAGANRIRGAFERLNISSSVDVGAFSPSWVQGCSNIDIAIGVLKECQAVFAFCNNLEINWRKI